MIEVLRAGLLTSVQDLGRKGYRMSGVCTSGALDTLALHIANRLVGNMPEAAGLEVTAGPVHLHFTQTTRVALSGADFNATLDDHPVHAWWSFPVEAGQTLRLHTPKIGMRAYLAIHGGIDVAPMLGSRSTDLKAGFGGLNGRALKDGDLLPLGATRSSIRTSHALQMPAFGIKAPGWHRFEHRNLREENKTSLCGTPGTSVRVLRGPEYSHFTAAAHEHFWSEPWLITTNSNRMGYRLAGPELTRTKNLELLSHAVLPGTIQVPGNGQPIVLMHDAQTTGGYAKIGVVIQADLWRLAQARLASNLYFTECTITDARTAYADLQRYLTQIEFAIDQQYQGYAQSTKAPA
ncbi:biotin-dependent carboxyltransferase family protein [Mycoavidus sp. B2-EB]|uniref:5-oxoprolinase subunit C family protein n=1 Tax=Mycoavidus sp. B2-EB TaxID=2651972 RepID=UPI001628E915|nr:biotin-dependent carboxyltransferase family protein [Mycoavidus sp. B2-EB]BBO58974.1 allophanate hydrolase [Mycoavidus sp. B2-EB]